MSLRRCSSLPRATTRTVTVPTLLERAGNFTDTRGAGGRLITIYDPSATFRASDGRTLRLYVDALRLVADAIEFAKAAPEPEPDVEPEPETGDASAIADDAGSGESPEALAEA
mgnify:CR=1 FL=1